MCEKVNKSNRSNDKLVNNSFASHFVTMLSLSLVVSQFKVVPLVDISLTFTALDELDSSYLLKQDKQMTSLSNQILPMG